MAITGKYTYAAFANEVIGLMNGTITPDAKIAARVMEKAQALLAAQESKALYNAVHPKKNTTKGASVDTKTKAAQIAAILDSTPKTAAEINAILGEAYTALQVANAVKFIDGARSEKVIREVTNAKGLKAQKEYTAYVR